MRRHIKDSDLWPICGEGQETTEHAILHCAGVHDIWRSVLEVVGSESDPTLSWRDAVIFWKNRNREECIDMAFTLAWQIWNRRNRWVFENKLLS